MTAGDRPPDIPGRAPVSDLAAVPIGTEVESQSGAPQCRRCGIPLPLEAAYCPACGWRNAPTPLPWWNARYWRVPIVGYVLFVLAGEVVRLTGNVNLLPTELALGSFLIPVSFVYFLYENGSFAQVPLATVVGVFIIGGVLGMVSAVLIEAGMAWSVTAGFVEEACKIAALAWWLRDPRLRGEGQGLVLGAAVGMGFAALETMGYGLTALITPSGLDLNAMAGTLMERGLMSPMGHGTWTAILAATLWREVTAGRSPFGRPVWHAYLLVAVLHSLWDLTIHWPLLARVTISLPFLRLPVATFLIGLAGLWLLRDHLVRTRRAGTRLI